MNRIWVTGDLAYVAGYPKPMLVVAVHPGIAVLRTSDSVLFTAIENLFPTEVTVRDGVVYDGDQPVGVL